jgi:hypothetical protein
MTSTATAARSSRALADEQSDYVRQRSPYHEAPGHANQQAYVQRPSALGVQEVGYLVVLSVVQLMWIAALVYGVVRILS